MSETPRFMQETRASHEKLSEAATKKTTKLSMFGGHSASGSGGSFQDLLLKAKRKSLGGSGGGEGSNTLTEKPAGSSTMVPFHPDEAKDARFGQEFKKGGGKKSANTSRRNSGTGAGGASVPAAAAPVATAPVSFPDIAFPPLPETFTNPQPSFVAEPSPSSSSSEGAERPSHQQQQQQGADNSAPVSRPAPTPSPTHAETMSEVADAERALADMDSLFDTSTTGDIPAEQQQVLAALTEKNGTVEKAEFARLIESVCSDALLKLQSTQASSNAGISAAEQTAAMKKEVLRLQTAGATMLANMNEIIAQMRSVVLDPHLLDESLAKNRMNREFAGDLVGAMGDKNNGSPANAGQQQQQVASSPGEPGAASPLMHGLSGSSAGVEGSLSRIDLGPILLSSPTRVEQLKRRLVKNGLRELLIDMTQEQVSSLDLLESPPARPLKAKSSADEAAELIGSSPVQAAVPARAQDKIVAETGADVEAEVDDIMASLAAEQSVISAHMSAQRAEAKRQREAEAEALRAQQALAAPPALSVSCCSPPSGPISLRSPSTGLSARSPRIQELLKVELAKEVRQLEQKVLQSERARLAARREARRASSAESSDSASSTDSSDLSDDEQRAAAKKQRSSLPPLHSSATPSKAAAVAAAAAAAEAAAQAQAAERAAKLALESEQLKLERERLAWDAEKLRLQQEHFAAQMAASKAQAEEAARAQEAHAAALEKARASANEAAIAAATAAANAGPSPSEVRALEAQKLELEKMKLHMEAEKMRMDAARQQLDQQMQSLKDAAAAAAAAAAAVPHPAPAPVHVTIHNDNPNYEGGGSRRPSQSSAAAAETKDDTGDADPGMVMKRNLAAYVAKRQEKRERKERREKRKREKELAKSGLEGYKSHRDGTGSKPHSRRNSLTGLPMVGSVSTTPADTGVVRSGHHRRSSGGSSAMNNDPSRVPTPGDGGAIMPSLGSMPIQQSRGSTRNLLQPWTAAELSANVPLKLFPAMNDVLSLPADQRSKAFELVAKHHRYDVVYREYLDPTGEATRVGLDRVGAEAASEGSALSAALQAAPLTIVTPRLFLALDLGVVALHKLTFLSRPRPCVEIYSVRSGRPTLVAESKFAPKECVEHRWGPLMMKLDDISSQGQLERDILIRVTHHPLHADIQTPRVLVGEVWTNLYHLLSSQSSAHHALLRARHGAANESKGPKEKGTLVINSASLMVDTSAGLVRYPCHPNRLLPLTTPAIYERKTDCTLSMVVSCRSLATLVDASFAAAAARGGKKSSSSHAPPRLAPFLEFYRQEEEGTWSSKPVFTTEETWAGSSLANAGAAAPSGKGPDDPHAPLHWKQILLPLFDLCFGDVRRNILCKVLNSPGSLSSTPTLLASFQFQVGEVLGHRDAAVVVLDPHVAAAAVASANASASAPAAKFSWEHNNTAPAAGRGNSSRDLASSSSAATLSELASPVAGASAVLDDSAPRNPPVLLFDRVHVYSSLQSVQKLVQRAGLAVPSQAEVAAAAAARAEPPAAVPLSRVVSGLHHITLLAERYREQGVDQSATVNFADDASSSSSPQNKEDEQKEERKE